MRKPGPSNIVLAVLGVLTVVLLVLAIQKSNSLSEPSSAAAAPAPPASTPASSAPAPGAPAPVGATSVAFIGDGYTSGSPDGGEGPANYTALLADREKWTVTNPSVYGSGYVAGAPFADQMQKAVDAQPKLVVVSGGRADSGQDPNAVRNAAGRLYQDLKTRLPQAKVAVIGPMWLGGDAPQDMRDVRDAIRDSATAAQLPFADPIDERWFNGNDQDGLTPNGENLNNRGHQRLSELVNDALRKANALPQ